MCGISGIFNLDNSQIKLDLIEKINNVIEHRGPDNGSVKIFNNVALGHRRLSIIDLSSEANQPMATKNERYTIVFNGEVYNFPEIRKKLESRGIAFKTNSDTEVVLYSFQEFGKDCFAMFNGMFALAIFDLENNEIVLARDQFGIKPLYYFMTNEVFVFGSEMKTILAHPLCKTDINLQGLSEYMWYGNPLGNNTFYGNISELGAGELMVLNKNSFHIESYFKIEMVKPKLITEGNAIKEIQVLLNESVKRHLISDVPVGVFLSGGIDSSAITAIASKYYNGRLKTFSVGFDFAEGPNELGLAAKVAKKFNTEHEEIQISGNNIIDVIEALVDAHDEPFGDAADIPLYLLTQKLKGKIKVVLQGDGGDEFFGGYSRYNTIQNAKKWSLLSFLSPLIKASRVTNTKLLRGQRFLNAISQNDPAVRNALLLTMESKYSDPLRIFNVEYKNILKEKDPFKRYREVYNGFDKDVNYVQSLFYADTQIILKDTYFEKVDKSTMANSIEVRVPFLDKELAEFMLSLPSDLKVKKGIQKYLLKKALDGIVPNEILYGKKTGFSVPYDFWLKTALADYFLQQISTSQAQMYLDKKEILRMFELNKQDKGNFGFLLWKTFIFAVWVNKNYL